MLAQNCIVPSDDIPFRRSGSSKQDFLNQMRRADFSSFAGIKEAFSLEAVSDEFYKSSSQSLELLQIL